MNNFSVTLNLQECFIDECCRKQTFEREVTITSTTKTVCLFNDFILNIIRVSSTYFTVLIQNGNEVIIRNIYVNSGTRILLPNKCGRHVICISGTINQV